MSYKAWMFTAGSGNTPATNGLAFETREEADRYAFDLTMRWTAVSHFEIRESDEEVNAAIREDKLVHL